MREIKFRVFLKEKNKLVYPEWIEFFKDYAEFEVKNEKGYSFYKQSYKNIDIMKATEFKDKNNTRGVFPKDFVNIRWFYEYNGGASEEEQEVKNVLLEEIGSCLGFYCELRGKFIPLCELENIHSQSFEILGNIYENTELLEGGNPNVEM